MSTMRRMKSFHASCYDFFITSKATECGHPLSLFLFLHTPVRLSVLVATNSMGQTFAPWAIHFYLGIRIGETVSDNISQEIHHGWKGMRKVPWPMGAPLWDVLPGMYSWPTALQPNAQDLVFTCCIPLICSPPS